MLVVRDRKKKSVLGARPPTASWLPVRPNEKFGNPRFQGSF
jgi:hypothetical protein